MKPIFNKETTVQITKGPHKDCVGKINEIHKGFKEVDSNDKFIEDGLLILDFSIPFIVFEKEFDGETLIIKQPESIIGGYTEKAYDQKSIFYDFYYNVQLSDFSVLINKEALREIQ